MSWVLQIKCQSSDGYEEIASGIFTDDGACLFEEYKKADTYPVRLLYSGIFSGAEPEIEAEHIPKEVPHVPQVPE